MRKPWRRVAALAAVVIVLGGAWLISNAYPFTGQGPMVVIRVNPGESVSQLANQLAADKVIGSPLAFRLDTMVFGSPILTPGYFQIPQNSSFDTVRSVFNGSPNAEAIDLTAGLTLHELAGQVAQAAGTAFADSFTSATKAAYSSPSNPWFQGGDVRPAWSSSNPYENPMEGLLGTGYYIIKPGETPSELVTAMEARFVTQAAAAGIHPGVVAHGLTPYEQVIAASIVEKEGYYPVNMPKTARVILNRLDKNMLLRMDSTVLYALGQDGGRVTTSMLRIDSRYNTYLYRGLTPTPICAVSSFAMNAISSPPPGEWLYFTLVSKDGTMAFSNTFAEQLANERLAASRGIL